MKNSILEYKGYHTRIVFDAETFTLRGKIEGINDLVNFESKDIEGIEREFHEAVDDYLAFCSEVGKEPEKEYKGTFNIRISPELHKKMVLEAYKNGESLNATIEKAIQEYLMRDSKGIIQEKTIYILSTDMSQRKHNIQNGYPVDMDFEYNSNMIGNNITMLYRES